MDKEITDKIEEMVKGYMENPFTIGESELRYDLLDIANSITKIATIVAKNLYNFGTKWRKSQIKKIALLLSSYFAQVTEDLFLVAIISLRMCMKLMDYSAMKIVFFAGLIEMKYSGVLD